MSIKMTPNSIKKYYYQYSIIPKDNFEHIIFHRIDRKFRENSLLQVQKIVLLVSK